MASFIEKYKEALKAAREQREELITRRAKLDDERTDIDYRIIMLDQMIAGLAPVCGETAWDTDPKFAEELAELKLADACRAILKAYSTFLTPVDIRNRLEKLGYDLSGQTNALASIHAILKRFAESGEVETLDLDGKTSYRLITTLERLTTGSLTQEDDGPNAEMNRLIREEVRKKKPRWTAHLPEMFEAMQAAQARSKALIQKEAKDIEDSKKSKIVVPSPKKKE